MTDNSPNTPPTTTTTAPLIKNLFVCLKMCSEPACSTYCCFYEFLKKIEAWRLAPVYPNAYRNLLNSSIHVATTNYYRNSFTIFQNDMKKTLSTIKHLIDNSKKYYIQACKRWVEYDRRNSCSRKFKLISYACRN